MGSGQAVTGSTRRDPTEIVTVEADAPRALTPTGLHSDGQVDGIIDLQIPNLLPTDNVVEEREVQVRRTKIPVRITNINVEVIDNGYIVHLPQAGRQHEYHGPDGARHAFSDKGPMLEFIGQVVGQVTYQYNESEMREETALKELTDALEGGDDVVFPGLDPTMIVQR
jgi:hypothetical protein